MWIFTTRGFFSVVENSKEPSELVIRARAKGDLLALKEFIPDLRIVALKNRDYEYRAFVRREQWEYTIVALTADIAYTNFKHEVEVLQGKKRAGIYLRIWGAALSIAPKRRGSQYSLFGGRA